MPYLQRSWVANSKEQAAPKTGRKLRKVPFGESEPSPAKSSEGASSTADPAKADAVRATLKTQIEELKAAQCATPIKGDENFLNYVIQKDQVVFEGKYSSIFTCFNYGAAEQVMICRIYSQNSMIIPENDTFLKILRHLGQKHPAIIASYGIYADESRHVYIFQEYGNRGNAYDYLKLGRAVITEKQVRKWGSSLYSAMDFLGDQGIAHRNISPKHILLKAVGDGGEVMAKLGSFRDAIIYYDIAAGDIIDQPCKPASKRQYGAFQAPEVYGEEGEFYNPVAIYLADNNQLIYIRHKFKSKHNKLTLPDHL